MKLVTNGFAPFLSSSDLRRKLRDVNEGTVFETTGEATTINGVDYVYVMDAAGVWGWVYVGYLDDYCENLPKDVVNPTDKTPWTTDAEQYLIKYGVKQTNLCGQMCVAHLLNITMDDLLAEWQAKQKSTFERVFNWASGRVSGGTGIADLQSMLSAFDVHAISLVERFRDPNIPSRRISPGYTPTKLHRIYRDGVIASVRISKLTGVLESSGILHWVVIKDVRLERYKMGQVEIYNPFMDRNETYSWREFVASARSPYGVAIVKP